MVGRQSLFPFGGQARPIFRGSLAVSFREDIIRPVILSSWKEILPMKRCPSHQTDSLTPVTMTTPAGVSDSLRWWSWQSSSSGKVTLGERWRFGESGRLELPPGPTAGCNRHHQDYSIFSRESSILGRGQTEVVGIQKGADDFHHWICIRHMRGRDSWWFGFDLLFFFERPEVIQPHATFGYEMVYESGVWVWEDFYVIGFFVAPCEMETSMANVWWVSRWLVFPQSSWSSKILRFELPSRIPMQDEFQDDSRCGSPLDFEGSNPSKVRSPRLHDGVLENGCSVTFRSMCSP